MLGRAPIGSAPLASSSGGGGSGGGTVYTLALAAGSYTLSGLSEGETAAITLDLTAGSFALTSGPSPTMFIGGYIFLTAGQFNFTPNITARVNRTLSLAAGSYALTPVSATFSTGYLASVGEGSFSITGRPIGFNYNRALHVAWSYAFGADPSVRIFRSVPLSISGGTYVLSGDAATMEAGYELATSAGTFITSGSPLVLRYDRALTGATGAFVLSGDTISARATHAAQLGSYRFNLDGSPATLRAGRKIAAGVGVFTTSGASMGGNAEREIVATKTIYTLAGQPATLTRSRRLQLSGGAFASGGGPISFGLRNQMSLAAGAFTLSGDAASATWSRHMMLSIGAFNLFTIDLDLEYSGAEIPQPLIQKTWMQSARQTEYDYPVVPEALGGIVLDPASFELSTNQAILGRQMRFAEGAYVLTGGAVNLVAA